MNDPLPKTLGRYEIRRELGRGMMGVVYEAVDPALGRRLALKTIRLAFEVPAAERDSFEKRFVAEARAAAVLQHPGIVVVHDVGRDEASGTPYIALEFLEGRTLGEEGAGGKPMEWPLALRIAGQVAEALHHAHGQGIVHRDIKPANIMLLGSGQAKIMDFGIAKLPASQLTVAGEFFGTPSYMSPEQAGGAAIDARSDLFSLGCVLHQLLTGRRAFDGPTLPAILMRVMKEDPPPPSRLVPGLPPGVDAVVGRALAKDPDRRYPDGRTLAEDVEDVLAGRPPRHAALPASASEAERTRASPAKPALSGATSGGTGRLEGILAPAAGTAVLQRDRPRTSRRRRIALAAGAATFLVLGFAGALVVPWRGQPPFLPVPTLAPPPGTLEVDFQHNLKGGTLKVWVDDELVLDEPLESRVTQKILSLRMRKGSL
ncbi:MAG TPA: serine/threonine-protein kinase, partial [Vicinamibacteria bacterium]|nr:serine/threonine-protein kinase [Vicinamibacteria bacterium]